MISYTLGVGLICSESNPAMKSECQFVLKGQEQNMIENQKNEGNLNKNWTVEHFFRVFYFRKI